MVNSRMFLAPPVAPAKPVIFLIAIIALFVLRSASGELIFTARNYGYYVVVNRAGEKISDHTTEREALEKASNLTIITGKSHLVRHNYEVEVEIVSIYRDEDGKLKVSEPSAETPKLNLMFTWSPPATREDGSVLKDGDIQAYRIYASNGNKEISFNVPNQGSTNSYEAIMPDNSFKSFQVSTVDKTGLESERSDLVQITP